MTDDEKEFWLNVAISLHNIDKAQENPKFQRWLNEQSELLDGMYEVYLNECREDMKTADTFDIFALKRFIGLLKIAKQI